MVSERKEIYTQNQTKPPFGCHFLAKKVDCSLYVSASVSYAKIWTSQCWFFPADCLMEGKNSTLSDPCKTPSVNKHRIHNEKQPTLKCLTFIIQTDFSNKESKQKHISNFQQIKGGGIMTNSVLFTLLTRLKSHTDFAQRFLHHHKPPPFLPS